MGTHRGPPARMAQQHLNQLYPFPGFSRVHKFAVIKNVMAQIKPEHTYTHTHDGVFFSDVSDHNTNGFFKVNDPRNTRLL